MQSQVDIAINVVTATLGITTGASVDVLPIEEDDKKPVAETARVIKDSQRNSDDQFYNYLAYKGLKSVRALELNKVKKELEL